MTNDEKLSIVNQVLSALRTNAVEISRLTATNEIADDDSFELSDGHRVSFRTLRELITNDVIKPTAGQSLVADTLIRKLESVIMEYRLHLNGTAGYKQLYYSGNGIVIGPDGFGITVGGQTYYVADPDRAKTYRYVPPTTGTVLLCVDVKALTNVNGRNDPASCIVSLTSGVPDPSRHIPIAFLHYSSRPLVIGQFGDFIRLHRPNVLNVRANGSFWIDFSRSRLYLTDIKFTSLSGGNPVTLTREQILRQLGQPIDQGFIAMSDGSLLYLNIAEEKVYKSNVGTANPYLSPDEFPLIGISGGAIAYIAPALADAYRRTILTQANVIYNNAPDTIRIDNDAMVLSISHNGFGIQTEAFGAKETVYVANTDKETTNYYTFGPEHHNLYVCVDMYTAFARNETRTNIAECITLKSIDRTNRDRYMPLAYIYHPGTKEQKNPARRIVLLGQFADLFGATATVKNSSQANADTAAINAAAFLPDCLSYRSGQRVADGQGQGWYRRLSLMHVSDVHRHWGPLADVLQLAQAHAHAVVDTGDQAHSSSEAESAACQTALNEYVSTVADNAGTVPVLTAQGNHDVFVAKEAYYNTVIQPMRERSKFVPGAAGRAYGRYDVTVPGESAMGTLRVIVLDPRDHDVAATSANWYKAYFSERQLNWLINCLKDAANTGKHVLTMMHYSFGDAVRWDEDTARPDIQYLQDPFIVPDIIDAMQQGKALTIDVPTTAEIGYTAFTLQVPALSKRLKYVAHLFGHIHSKNEYWCAKADGSKKYDILMLGETSLGDEGVALNRVRHESGTINAVGCSLLHIDTAEQAIYRVSYGAYKTCDGQVTERVTRLPYRLADAMAAAPGKPGVSAPTTTTDITFGHEFVVTEMEDGRHVSVPTATITAPGLMSAADKTKLDSLTTGGGSGGGSGYDPRVDELQTQVADLNDMLTGLLAKDVTMSLTATPAGPVEYGTEAKTVTLTPTVKGVTSGAASEVTVTNGTVVVGKCAPGGSVSAPMLTEEKRVDGVIKTVVKATTWTAQAKYLSKTLTATATVKVAYPLYYGTAPQGEWGDIKGTLLTAANKRVQSAAAGSYALRIAGAAEYLQAYWVLPPGYTITSVKTQDDQPFPVRKVAEGLTVNGVDGYTLWQSSGDDKGYMDASWTLTVK